MVISDPKKRWTDRLLTRRYILTAAIAGVILSIGGYGYWRFRTIGIALMPLRMGSYDPGEILVRGNSGGESDTLFIGILKNEDEPSVTRGRADPVPTGPIYQFMPKSYQLEFATLDDWNSATGPITFRYFDRFRSEVLRGSRTPLRIAGAYHLDRDVSPDRKYVNVVSANGPIGKGSFGFFFGGGGGAYPRGPIYHEVFDRLTGAKVGNTYTLKQPGDRVSLSFCWEANGKYIAYHDMFGRFLWVVPGPNHPSSKTPLQHTSTGQQKQEKSDD
jgi:hypothetical protein